MEPSVKWHIVDRLHGQEQVLVQSYLHFHPDFEICRQGAGRYRVVQRANGEAAGLLSFSITVTGNMEISLETGWYCPEFGVRHEAAVLVMRTRATLPVECGYSIEKL